MDSGIDVVDYSNGIEEIIELSPGADISMGACGPSHIIWPEQTEDQLVIWIYSDEEDSETESDVDSTESVCGDPEAEMYEMR